MVLRVVLFLVVFALLDALGHAYLYLRMVRRPGWGRPATRRALTMFLIAMAVLLPLGIVAGRWLPRESAQPLAYVAFIWMGVLFYLVVLFGLFDLGRAGVAIAKRVRAWLETGEASTPAVDPVRRRLLQQGAAVTVGTASVGLSGLALRDGLGDLELREVGVRLERLPSTLSGLTLVQLSDLHVGPTIGRGFVASVVERVNRQRPDAVVITGDLVDGSVPALLEHVAPLAKLRSRYGTFFVTGNHEYYSGADAWAGALGRLGIRVLRNERVALGDDGGRVDLVGIEDWSVYRHEAEATSRLLAEGADPERERILLAHQPRAVGEAARLDAGLQLSGHTHGGQLFPFSAIVALTTPYLAGLYRHDRRTQVYVSRGTGYWGPPMRLLAPSEITKIVLG